MELHDDWHFATENGMKARGRERNVGNFLPYEDELKSSQATAGSEIGDEGRGILFTRNEMGLLYGRWRAVSRESFYWT